MKLSVPIASLDVRAEMLRHLVQRLDHIGNGIEGWEVVVDVDAGQKTIGRKRQDLLERAKGDFVVFHVDDDWQNGPARDFFAQWRVSLERGDFNGSWRREEGDAEDERYHGHRHDQSAASIIAHRLGMRLDVPGNLCQYYAPSMPPSVVLTLRGL